MISPPNPEREPRETKMSPLKHCAIACVGLLALAACTTGKNVGSGTTTTLSSLETITTSPARPAPMVRTAWFSNRSPFGGSAFFRAVIVIKNPGPAAVGAVPTRWTAYDRTNAIVAQHESNQPAIPAGGVVFYVAGSGQREPHRGTGPSRNRRDLTRDTSRRTCPLRSRQALVSLRPSFGQAAGTAYDVSGYVTTGPGTAGESL